MATYFRVSANSESEVSELLGMYSYIADIIYHGENADIIVNDIALTRVYIVETLSEIAYHFDN